MAFDIFKIGSILRLKPEVTQAEWFDPTFDVAGDLYEIISLKTNSSKFLIRMKRLGSSGEGTTYPKDLSFYNVYYIPCSSRSEAREIAKEFGLSVIDNGDSSQHRWAVSHTVSEI